MSFWKRLFGGPPAARDADLSEEQLEHLRSLRVPAIALAAADHDTRSRIGGSPDLPAHVAWPEWQSSPLAFLCQLDLSEIPNGCARNGLPQTGVLFFFYDVEQRSWGFDPKDRGSWRVLYEPSPGPGERAAPAGLAPEGIYRRWPVRFAPIETYPDWQDDRVHALGLSDAQLDRYQALCAGVHDGAPEHRLFGHPSPVQGNEMELECQLASNGVYCGDPSGYETPRAKALESGRGDWTLLFQLDTDDDIEMMWGDCGRLYFWIKKQDLAAARFDDVWMVLQCG